MQEKNIDTEKIPSNSRSEILEDLLIEAGEATHAPSPPLGGIPRRWIPSWIRLPIKYFILPFVLTDHLMQKIAKKILKPPFKQEGSCKRRGNCCHYVLIGYSKSLIGRLFYFWYTQFQGFYPRYPDPQSYEGKKMYVMGCRYLKKDGGCGQYRLRPLICRLWPVIEHFGYPSILKGCGYRSNPPYPFDTPDDHLSEKEDSRLKVLN